MMSIRFIVALLLFSSTVGAFADQSSTKSIITDDETYRMLSGVWNFINGKLYKKPMEYSWGISNVVLIDGSVVIDLGGSNPIIYAPQMGLLKIKSVKKKNESMFVLETEWIKEDGTFLGSISVELLDPIHIVIYDKMKPFHFLDWSGPEHRLTKVDGPN
jgi:hypothetical protein